MGRLFSQSQKLLLLRKAGYRCSYCGVKLTSENLAADHKIPFAWGGATQVWNGQALCTTCNARKGQKMEGKIDEDN